MRLKNISPKTKDHLLHGHFLTVITAKHTPKDTDSWVQQNKSLGAKKKRYIRVYSVESQPSCLTPPNNQPQSSQIHQSNIIDSLRKYLSKNGKIDTKDRKRNSSNALESPIQQLNIFDELADSTRAIQSQSKLKDEQTKPSCHERHWCRKKVRLYSQLPKPKQQNTYFKAEC